MNRVLTLFLAVFGGALFAAGIGAQGIPPAPPLCVCTPQSVVGWYLPAKAKVTAGAWSTTKCTVASTGSTTSCSIAGTITFTPALAPYAGMMGTWSAPQTLNLYALSTGTDAQTAYCDDPQPLVSRIWIGFFNGNAWDSVAAMQLWYCVSQ